MLMAMATGTAIANIRCSIRDTNCESMSMAIVFATPTTLTRTTALQTNALTSTGIESHTNILGRNEHGLLPKRSSEFQRDHQCFF